MGFTNWWPGTILKVNGGGTCDIKYQDSEVGEAVPKGMIKADKVDISNRLLECPVEALLGKRLVGNKWRKGWPSMVEEQCLAQWMRSSIRAHMGNC